MSEKRRAYRAVAFEVSWIGQFVGAGKIDAFAVV